MRRMLVTVRLPGARMAPTSRTSAWRQVRWRNSGAKATMIAAKRAGRSSMAASLGGNAASLPHRSLRRPRSQITRQKWPNSSLGPATLILAHEKITHTPAQEVFESFDPPPISRQAYTRCAEAPKQQRSARCDKYVSFFEQCAIRKNECGAQSVYEVLTKLILSAAPQKPTSKKVAIPVEV